MVPLNNDLNARKGRPISTDPTDPVSISPTPTLYLT